jgi:capsular polysaccharide biosynthesis protein
MESITSIDNINELLLSGNKISSPLYNNSIISETKSEKNPNNIKLELLKINEENYKKYNEVLESYNIIEEIYTELKEKQQQYIKEIKYLLDLQTNTNKLFLELSKKKFN